VVAISGLNSQSRDTRFRNL